MRDLTDAVPQNGLYQFLFGTTLLLLSTVANHVLRADSGLEAPSLLGKEGSGLMLPASVVALANQLQICSERSVKRDESTFSATLRGSDVSVREHNLGEWPKRRQ